MFQTNASTGKIHSAKLFPQGELNLVYTSLLTFILSGKRMRSSAQLHLSTSAFMQRMTAQHPVSSPDFFPAEA